MSERLRAALQSAFDVETNGGRSAVTLVNVRIPKSVLADDSGGDGGADHEEDDEGLVLTTLSVSNEGTYRYANTNVGATKEGDIEEEEVVIDCGGTVALPLFCDPHTHLVKTHTTTRCRNPTGTINDSFRTQECDRPRWTKTDMERRMDFAIQCAHHHGTWALRTHLDGTHQPTEHPALCRDVFELFQKKRDELLEGTYGMVLQGVVNLYLPLWSVADVGPAHAALAARYGPGILLGAYCGSQPGECTEAMFTALFQLAATHGLDVDFHMDETNDPDCLHFLPCLRALKRARTSLSFTGAVTFGHCCSLALQTPATVQTVISLLRDCGRVAVVANPLTNLFLQDRRGQTEFCGLPIDGSVARTPTWRGITSLQELEAGGVLVAAASDNVRDYWNHYGDYDGLGNYSVALNLAHLDTAPHEGHWAGLCTVQSARVMGLDEGPSGLARLGTVGRDANLILFPGARHFNELFARPQTGRVVLRKGVWTPTTLPDYEELDDLVATKTNIDDTERWFA